MLNMTANTVAALKDSSGKDNEHKSVRKAAQWGTWGCQCFSAGAESTRATDKRGYTVQQVGVVMFAGHGMT